MGNEQRNRWSRRQFLNTAALAGTGAMLGTRFEAIRIDAFLGFPPDPQELRAKKIGHVIVDSGKDRPWSQYFCCMVGANRDFVRKHPVAAKRALRAILKASNLCALEPERVAGLIANRGYDYNYSLETLRDIPYDKWRDYDAED